MAAVSVVDYIVFALVLLISLAIGIFYSFRQKTTSEYVHGSHNMKLLPVSMSLVVSFISAITVQGLPAEVYMYGIEICFMLAGIVGILAINVTFLPVFFQLKPTTIYDYLELRFKSQYPKILGSTLALCTMILYSGMILFGPAAALESLIGIPTGYNIIAMAGICTIYTSIGGIKGVIWTDVFQAVIMFIGIITVIIIGFIHIDVHSAWTELQKHGRTSLNFNPSLLQRNSVWIYTFMTIISHTEIFCKQSAMVRYTALPTIKQARQSSVITAFGFLFLQGLSILMGLVVFVYYSQQGCGPMASGKIYTSNQIIPFFLIEVGNYPGIPGFFVSAIVASTLSSVSSAQNSISTIIWKIIFMKIKFINEMTEKRKIMFLKIVTMSLGFLTTVIAFGAMYAGGTLYQVAAAILGIVGTPAFGMFLLGGCCTFVSSTAAVIGCITMTLFCACLSYGKLFYGTVWVEPTLIKDTCMQSLNATNNLTSLVSGYDITSNINIYTNISVTASTIDNSNNVLMQFFSISSYAYPLFGVFGTFVIGVFLSIFPCMRNKEKVDERLLIPLVKIFMRKNNQSEQEEGVVLLSKTLKNCNDTVLIN